MTQRRGSRLPLMRYPLFCFELHFQKLIDKSSHEADPITTLPLLHSRSNINLPCESSPRLSVQVPIRIRNLKRLSINANIVWEVNTYSLGADLCVRARVLQPLLGPWNIDDTVNDGMTNMDTLGTKLSRQTLAQAPDCPFASRKRSHEGRTLDRRRCTGEDERGRVLGLGSSIEKERQRSLREEEGTTCRDIQRGLEFILSELEEGLANEATGSIEDGRLYIG